MRRIWGEGICGRCNHKTKWYDTILEKNAEVIIQEGGLRKSVSKIKKRSFGDKCVYEIICEMCGNHYDPV